MKTIHDWIEINNLSVSFKHDYVLCVDGIDGLFMYLDFTKFDKVFDSNLNIILYEEIMSLIPAEYDDLIKFILFEFGGRFYYTKVNNESEFVKVEFNDFKWLGNPNIDNCGLDFIHLGVHDEYELLNGSRQAKDWAAKAKFLQMPALGICDHNTLAGTLAFQTECLKLDIKPILGLSFSIRYDRHGDNTLYFGRVYVLNKSGWQNVLRINKKINVDNNGFIDESDLLQYADGLCFVFPKDSILSSINDNAALALMLDYRKQFTLVFYQIDSVQFSSNREQLKHLENIKYYVDHLSDFIEPILINDSYYIDIEEYGIKKILNQIGGTAAISSKNQHFKSVQDVVNNFYPLFSEETAEKVFVKMFDNTKILSDSVDFKIETGHHRLPVYIYKGQDDEYVDLSNDDLFLKLIGEGFDKKLSWIEDEKTIQAYQDRLVIECNVIMGAGFVDYFLILWDIIRFSLKESQSLTYDGKEIMVGIGRGSVGGSLIAYLLDLIDIDPLKYNLLFERFLNETRVEPEIYFDVEFEDGQFLHLRPGDKLCLTDGSFLILKNDVDLDFTFIDVDIDETVKLNK